jgi:hypothetical protein
MATGTVIFNLLTSKVFFLFSDSSSQPESLKNEHARSFSITSSVLFCSQVNPSSFKENAPDFSFLKFLSININFLSPENQKLP